MAGIWAFHKEPGVLSFWAHGRIAFPHPFEVRNDQMTHFDQKKRGLEMLYIPEENVKSQCANGHIPFLSVMFR